MPNEPLLFAGKKKDAGCNFRVFRKCFALLKVIALFNENYSVSFDFFDQTVTAKPEFNRRARNISFVFLQCFYHQAAVKFLDLLFIAEGKSIVCVLFSVQGFLQIKIGFVLRQAGE